MPRLCAECERQEASSPNLEALEDQNLENLRILENENKNKFQNCKNVTIWILKAIFYSSLAIISGKICWAIYDGFSICFWNFVFQLITPFLRFLVWTTGLLFFCMRDQFQNNANDNRAPETSAEDHEIIEN